MVDFNLERLGWREFEHLTQDLCTAALGARTCIFGDGPDGGREATIEGRLIWDSGRSEAEVWDGYIVVQAKFHRRPEGVERNFQWLRDEIRKEFSHWTDPKYGRSRTRRPDYLIIVTNLELSAATDGGIDRANEELSRLASEYLPGVRCKLWHYTAIRSLVAANGSVRDLYFGPEIARLERVRSIYAAHVRQFSPEGGLRARGNEMSSLAEFCEGEEPYQWLQGDPWAGKTALTAWFALNPPTGIEIVSFFISKRLTQTDSTAFILSMTQQLASLVGRTDIATAAPEGQWSLLLAEAAELLGRRGSRLLLLIDGLDEDESPSVKITELLPARLPKNVRVLVTSRTHPDVPSIVLPASHPLRRCVPRQLAPSPHAQHLQFEAQRELTQRLRRQPPNGHPFDADIIGFITASGGGLTAADIAALTGQLTFDVNIRLASSFGRVLRKIPLAESLPAPPGCNYIFAHETLLTEADSVLADDIEHYLSELDRWADDYRQDAWPQIPPHTSCRLMENDLRNGETRGANWPSRGIRRGMSACSSAPEAMLPG